MGIWLERWMEGKHEGRRKETDQEVQQAGTADGGSGVVDGVLGDSDPDVLAVSPVRRQAGARRGPGQRDAGPGESTGNSTGERKAR